MKAKNLKLIVHSDEDLRVVSAHLQDSIVLPEDIVSIKKNKIFIMQLNRFMWEDVEKGIFRQNKRVRTVLKFENVINASYKNINQKKPEVFLDFLAIESSKLPDKSYEIKLIFSGNAIIKINSEVIDASMEDQGEPWESKTKPKHIFS